jgi:small subunit ribosomal protein S6
MREYELTVVYDLAVTEAGGPDASVQQLTTAVEARGGLVLKVDHWGRRRLAYPINRAVDGDYIVSRVELEPGAVSPLEAALRIDERVFRHLVVRADELPPPPPPRELRMRPDMPAEAAAAPAAEAAPGAPAVEYAAPSVSVIEDAPAAPAVETPGPAMAAESPAAEAPAAESAAPEAPAAPDTAD